MSEPTPRKLPLFSSKNPSTPVNADLSVFCSPHDLIAIVTADNDVVIYRLNGQVAFTVKCKDPDEVSVSAVEWKPDGSLLAVGWSDGSWGVHDGGSGKLVSEGRVAGSAGGEEWKMDLEPGWGPEDEEEGAVGVAGFGWEKHEIPPSKATARALAEQRELDTEGWAEGLKDDEEDDEDLKAAAQLADLPRAITTLDTTKLLPRMSAIPSHGLRAGPEGARFATQATTDGVFEVKKLDVSGSVDALIVYTKSGDVRVLLDDSVPIGSFSFDSIPFKHASHPLARSHVLLSRTSEGQLQYNTQDLPLGSLGGPLLNVIARDTKRMQSTLAYLTQVIRCITHDYTTELQFPTRLMNNINMMLSESDQPQGDLAYNLRHLAMTGQLTPIMLEWLTDIVKEPNHKRWDTAIGGMYSRIQNHVFVNLLPALDRMSMAVCSLRGQADFHKDTTTFDVEPLLFSNILEGIDALRLAAQKIQLICIHEWQQFRAFSKWLRVQIEIGTAGPFSKNALETEEKEAMGIDHGQVLAYINETMKQSKLISFVQKLPELRGVVDRAGFFKQPVLQQICYNSAKQALERLEEPTPANEVKEISPSLNLQAIAVSLTGHVRVVLDRITTWQSKMLPSSMTFDGPETVPAEARACDMRMIANRGGDLVVNVLLADKATLYLHTKHSSKGSHELSPESNDQPSSSEDDEELLDAKFLSEKHCILLRRTSEESESESDTNTPHYSLNIIHLEPGLTTPPSFLSAEAVLHHFAPDDAFRPERLLVGGRRDKQVCVVFGDAGKAWRVFDLSRRYVDAVLPLKAGRDALGLGGAGEESVVW
jgi:anaphase-promoting complex subunit 4